MEWNMAIMMCVCDGKHDSKGMWNEYNEVIRMNSLIKSSKGISSLRI